MPILKNIIKATIPLILTSFSIPAWGITLGDLDPNTGIIVESGYRFSNFITTDIGGTGDITELDALVVTTSFVNNILTINFSATGGATPPLPFNTAGQYGLTYTIDYIGLPPQQNFVSIGQVFSCTSCGDSFVDTQIFDIPNYVLPPPIEGSTAPIGSAVNSVAQTNFNKAGGADPIYADTFIDLQGGTFNGLTNTYGVQEVPWETDVLPLVGATILFGGGMWWKRRRAASQINLTGQGSEQEPGQK